MNHKIWLFILALILVIFGLNSPMTLVFPLWIFTYLFKNKLAYLLSKIPKEYGFIISGILFGLLIEIFAIFQNLPKSEKVLLSPDPFLDLIYGFVYYASVIIVWYLILKRINFSKKEVFFLTGIYGIFVEESGRVFLSIFTTGIVGPLYAMLVMTIYGLFPYLAYVITEKSFNKERRERKLWHYFLVGLALFLQWAVFGNFILPFLKKIVVG